MNAQQNHLTPGTRVLNIRDGEPGTIVSGVTFDPGAGGWTEYEVETRYGIERWQRGDFEPLAELEAATRD